MFALRAGGGGGGGGRWGENAFATVGGEYGCGSHEGHSGWTCEDLASIITDSAISYSPDVVLLMCGTNDLYYRASTLKPEKGGNVTEVRGLSKPAPRHPG